MKKRVLALVLALVMVMEVLPFTAFAEKESNNTMETANLAELNAAESGYLSAYLDKIWYINDVDWFKYEIPYAGDFEVRVGGAKEGDMILGGYWVFELYDKAGEKLASVEVNGYKGTKKGLAYISLEEKCDLYIKVTHRESSIKGQSAILQNYKYEIKNTFKCAHEGQQTETQLSSPTCAEEGKIEFRCEDCGKIAKVEYIDKLPHTPDGEWVTVKEPTCSETGLRTQTCTVCGGTAEEEKLDRLEHTYSKWKVTKEANCKERGERVRTCSVCGNEEKETISISDDHDFGDWEVTRKATCTVTGLETRKCRLCGKEETETISKAKHEYGDWTTEQEATCGKAGEELRKCRNCGETESRELPATGKHTFGEWNRENESRFHRACTVCGYTENRYMEPKVEIKEEGEWAAVIRANADAPSEIILKPISFADVSASAWYHSVVTYAYNLGLMVGNSETSFNPAGNMTLAEAVTMASRARNSYKGGTNADFKASKVWYQTYVDYALEQGILKQGDFDDYERPATRAEMAYLFARALPAEGMKAINTVEKLPDVKESGTYGKEIFTLYRAGVLTGQDGKGTFAPESPITRAEAAAIITRVTLSSERKSLNLK